jgi:polar amino acid transport system substrate-binding protein
MRYISNLVIFLISLNVLATYASEDIEIGTVRIATGSAPPYYDASLPGGGPLTMNIMLACKEANLECEIDFLPWNRAYSMLEAGEIDMAFSFSKNEERLKKFVYSREPVLIGTVSIFFIRSKFPNGIHFTEYEDLVGYTMLGFDPAWYAADFKKIGINTIWLLTNSNKWKMLLYGRGDALLADTYQGLYELRQHEQESDAFEGSIGFTVRSYTADSGLFDYIVFSRPHFDKRRQQIRDSLDQAFKKLDVATTVMKALDGQYSGDTHEVQ